MRIKLAAGLLALSCGLAQAGELDLHLSSETLQATWRMDTAAIGYGGGTLSLGGFYNDRNDLQFALGLGVQGTPSADMPLTLGVGVSAYFSFIDAPTNANVQAVALAGLAKFHIPARMPMAVGGRLHYAPDITTFGDGKDFLDWSLDFELEFMPSAAAFAGYRQQTVGLETGGDYDLEDNFHVGVRFVF